MDSKTRARIGPYEILAPLGAGGMGEVFRARDTRLGREVALKLLPNDLSEDREGRARFEREARALAALNHPGIAVVHAFEEVEGKSVLAMELLDGETMREKLRAGPLPLRKALDWAAQIARALAAAHANGIVHRDLKPENLFVTRDGTVKILDFGLARQASVATTDDTKSPTVAKLTSPGIVMGTVGYMSPEQASGRPVDFSSDQFSFGSVLYEMASGRRAFHRPTGAETIVAIIREEPEPLATASPTTPVPLRWIVERCLAKEPSERFASTEDLARDLQHLREHVSEIGAPGEVAAVSLRRRGRPLTNTLMAAALLAAVAVGALAGKRFLRDVPSVPSFQQITFRRGTVEEARFAPDGQTIVYSAAWEGNPTGLFTTRPGATESQELGVGMATICSISSRGEMAFLLDCGITGEGTLARAPLAGGAPREILENVRGADWSPDGKEFAIVRDMGGRCRLEYPTGKVLFDIPTTGQITGPRFSPGGERILFVERPSRNTMAGSLGVIDLSSGRKILTTNSYDTVVSPAWSPEGNEIWFSDGPRLRAVTLSGKERLVHASSGLLQLCDISRGGRLLMNSRQLRFGINALVPGNTREIDLSWLDKSYANDLSPDGTVLLFDESGEGGGPNESVYVRRTDGSPAVRLGDGWATALTPDGKWALTLQPDRESDVVFMPTGAGEARVISYPEKNISLVRSFPDGRHLLLVASEKGHGARLWVSDMSGNNLRSISSEGVDSVGAAVSPDGGLAAATGTDGLPRLYPVEGGVPRPVPGGLARDIPIRFSADGRFLYALLRKQSAAEISRLDLASGRRELWKSLAPSDRGGYSPSTAAQITPDGRFYAYTYRRVLSELFIADGLR